MDDDGDEVDMEREDGGDGGAGSSSGQLTAREARVNVEAAIERATQEARAAQPEQFGDAPTGVKKPGNRNKQPAEEEEEAERRRAERERAAGAERRRGRWRLRRVCATLDGSKPEGQPPASIVRARTPPSWSPTGGGDRGVCVRRLTAPSQKASCLPRSSAHGRHHLRNDNKLSELIITTATEQARPADALK